MSPKPSALVPDAASRWNCHVVAAPHPSTLDLQTLTGQCELRTQPRSGPGGQHRNRTSSGAFLTHVPTGTVAEATERRSQAHNRDVALTRLRFLLALSIRTASPLDPDHWHADAVEDAYRDRYRRHPLRIAETNPDKPAVVALVLNDLWIAGGQPSLVARCWSVSTSRVVALLRSYPAALAWANQLRDHHGRLPLH